MTRMMLSAAVVVVVATGVPLVAHHAFSRDYFEDQKVQLEGDVSSFEFRNPHTLLHFNAPDATGVVQRFTAEWANPGRLERSGVTKDTIKPGDHVVVTGAPGRANVSRQIHLKSIYRPADGWQWAGPQGGR